MNNYVEVDFETYCKTCEYSDNEEWQDPCCECLDYGYNEETRKPVEYKERKE